MAKEQPNRTHKSAQNWQFQQINRCFGVVTATAKLMTGRTKSAVIRQAVAGKLRICNEKVILLPIFQFQILKF